MLNPLYYGIGFLIYFLFNSLTMKFYSKIPGTVKKRILLWIFGYYSLLAIYIMYIVESFLGASIFEFFVESGIFILIGFILLSFANIEIIN